MVCTLHVCRAHVRARACPADETDVTGHVVTGVDVTNFYETMTVRRELFL